MDHGPITLLPLNIRGIDLSITNQVLMLLLATILAFAFVSMGVARKRLYPLGAIQNLVEVMLDFVRETIAVAFL